MAKNEEWSPETKKLIQQVSRETAKAVSHNVAAKAVRDTLISVGIDPSDPLSAQDTQASMRKIAACADDLSEIAKMYREEDTRDAIEFAKDARAMFKSTKARAMTGALMGIWLTLSLWAGGVFDKIRNLAG